MRRTERAGSAFPRLFTRALGVLVLAGLAALPGCTAGDLVDEGGSETHFLSRCEGTCGGDFVCRCGVCTRACAESASCADLAPGAACVALAPRVAALRCASAPEPATCEVPCVSDADCAELGAAARCTAGYCRVSSEPSDAPEPPRCEPRDIEANAIVVIGDSLLQLSGFAGQLEGVASENGALAEGDGYRDYSSAERSFLAQGPASVATQYTMSQNEGTARVVVMNGGATDMLSYPCQDALTPDCPQVRDAVRGAEQLFQRMADDGVEHVIYLSYPQTRNARLNAGLDVLLPLVENVCGKSPLACHWLDLRPVFDGHDEYFGPDGIVLSEAGARATAAATWELMQSHCIPR